MQSDSAQTTATTMQDNGGVFQDGILDGVKLAIPIIVGFLPVGFAFGVLATKNGISGFNTILMSFIVLAGSSQFIAVSLFAAAVSPIAIIVTTFIVNLRHLLMSAAIAPHVSSMGFLKKLLFSFQLIDETFAIHMTSIEREKFGEASAFTLNCIAHFCWVSGTALGVFGSNLVHDIKPLGFDYALPAMFVALLIWQLRSNMHIIVAAFSAICSVTLYLAGAEQLSVILAAIIGATTGVVLCSLTKK